MNVQGSFIDESQLRQYVPEPTSTLSKASLSQKAAEAIGLLKKSQRPVLIAGHGIRLAGAISEFAGLLEKLGVPVVSTFNGIDIIPSDHPLFIGRIGSLGDRAGNFAIQNSDFVLSIGSRNNIRQVSYNWGSFARHAVKVVVDIDSAELRKPTLKPDLPINADARDFIRELGSQLDKGGHLSYAKWVGWCLERRRRYPVVLPEYRQLKKLVNPYCFIEELTSQLPEGATLVAANGTACVAMFQAGIVKRNQRMFWNSGCAAMGYDLPAAIGASFARNKGEVVCLAGDGSLQLNMQELETVVYHDLPIKLFVLNNGGYISIKQTQDSFFGGHYVACDSSSGIGFPDFRKVASAYGFKTELIDKQAGMSEKIRWVLEERMPILCEVKLLTDYKFMPKLSSEKKQDGRIISKPLEDMYPFLERKEFKENMLVPEWTPEK
mgnify:CR=1 FL=1